MNRKIAFIQFVFLFIFFNTRLYSQIISSEREVLLMTESQDGSLLAVSNGESVSVYDSSDYALVGLFYDEKVSQMSFYKEGGSDYFADITKDGQFIVRKLFSDNESAEEIYYSADCADPTGRKALVALAVSNNSDYIAAAFNDYSVQVHFRLRVTAGSISHTITSHKAPVYGLEFSKNGEYLATVSTDGNAYIWNSYTSSQISHIKGVYTRAKVPVVFSSDSVYVIFQDGRNSFKITDFSGNTLYSIAVGRPITAIKALKDPDLIAVRNDKGEVMVYSISSRRPLSVSNALFEEGITEGDFTAFDFDYAADKMYAGYKNGKVYIVEPQPYLDDTAMLITDASLAGRGSGNFLHQRFSSLSVSAGINYMTWPYLLSVNLRSEYLYSEKISPFFVGAGLILSTGFPASDFPADYKIGGQNVDAPKLLSAALYLPAGYAFSPWNNDIRIITTFKVGAKINSLALISSQGYIIGEPDFSFFMSAGAGMQIKWFEFDINCEYDTIGKVSPSLYAGYVYRWGEK